jgi:hypothetical protein
VRHPGPGESTLGVPGEVDRLRRLGTILEVELGEVGDYLEEIEAEARLRLVCRSFGSPSQEEVFLAPHEDLCTVAGSQCNLHRVPAAEMEAYP